MDIQNNSLENGANQDLNSAIETPIRPDAFDRDDELKMELIQKHFTEIMHVLGLDLNDDSLKDTPKRVSKMFVQEIFKGLNPNDKPSISLFENKYNYQQMLVEKDIAVHSTCEHHFLPITGKAHVAYFSSGKVIGLSKINRLVEYFSKRPQVQERLTVQLLNEFKQVLETDDVAVVIDAHHHCVSSRGIQDECSTTITSSFSGKFQDMAVRQEFFNYLK